MNRKKGLTLLIFSLVLMSVFSSFASADLGELWDDVSDTLFRKIGGLEFLGIETGTAFTGFLRLLIGIMIFAILYGVASQFEFIPKNIAIVIALCLAVMSVVFIPTNVLAGISGVWATLFGLLFLGAPVALGIYGIYKMPSDNRGYILLKIIIIIFLIIILNSIKALAEKLAQGPGAVLV